MALLRTYRALLWIHKALWHIVANHHIMYRYKLQIYNALLHRTLLRIRRALLRIHWALWHSVTRGDIMCRCELQIGIFCGHIGLFCGYAGLFCGYIGLFCGYIGLFGIVWQMMIDHMQIQGCSANIVTLSDVRKSPMYPQKSRMYPQKSPMYQLIQTPSDVRMNQIKSCVRMGVSHIYEYNIYEYQIYMNTLFICMYMHVLYIWQMMIDHVQIQGSVANIMPRAILICEYIWLFCGYIRLFCGYIGLFGIVWQMMISCRYKDMLQRLGRELCMFAPTSLDDVAGVGKRVSYTHTSGMTHSYILQTCHTYERHDTFIYVVDASTHMNDMTHLYQLLCHTYEQHDTLIL